MLVIGIKLIELPKFEIRNYRRSFNKFEKNKRIRSDFWGQKKVINCISEPCGPVASQAEYIN